MFSVPSSYTVLGALVIAAILLYRHVKPSKVMRKIPSLTLAQCFSYIFKPKQKYMEKFPVNEMLTHNPSGVSKLWMVEWMVMLYDPAFVREFAQHPDTYAKFDQFDKFPGSIFTSFFGPNIVFSNGEQWRRHRRAVNPIFRKPWPPTIFANCTNNLIANWGKMGDTFTVEIHDWMQRLTFDVLGLAILDMDFQAINDKDSKILENYRLVIDGMMDYTWTLLYFLDRPWNPLRRRQWKALDDLNDTFNKVIKEKKEQVLNSMEKEDEMKKTEKDLMTLMLEANLDPENPTLSDIEIIDNLKIFIIAGHDTTATALTTELYNLALDQEAQKRARNEVLEALGEDDHPTLNTKLPYLDAVIKESMRLYPPLVEYPIRIVTKDLTVKSSSGVETLIPKGTIALLETVMLQRNKLVWDRPNDFYPERWLEKDISVTEEQNMGYFPFSGGSRICLGMNFSLLEQRVVLAMLLREYEWRLPEDTIHTDELKFYGSKMFGTYPVPVIFNKRERNESH